MEERSEEAKKQRIIKAEKQEKRKSKEPGKLKFKKMPKTEKRNSPPYNCFHFMSFF